MVKKATLGRTVENIMSEILYYLYTKSENQKYYLSAHITLNVFFFIII